MNRESLSIPGLHGPGVNVGAPERMLCVFAGGALAALALRQKSWSAAALAASSGLLLWRGVTGHSVAYSTAHINTAEPELMSQHTEQTVTIEASPEELYAFWRDFENLPKIMYYLESVSVLDDRRSSWTAKGPAGNNIRWDAEIVHDVPNQRIAWRSVQGAKVPNAGSVEFRPASGNRGTCVQVRLEYQLPGGTIGATAAKLLGREPGAEIREDLRRLKQIMEAGEIPTTQGQPAAHRHSIFGAFSASQSE